MDKGVNPNILVLAVILLELVINVISLTVTVSWHPFHRFTQNPVVM